MAVEEFARVAFAYAAAARNPPPKDRITRSLRALGSQEQDFVSLVAWYIGALEREDSKAAHWSKLSKKLQREFETVASFTMVIPYQRISKRDESLIDTKKQIDALRKDFANRAPQEKELLERLINPLERRQHPVAEDLEKITRDRLALCPSDRLFQEFTAAVELPGEGETVHEIFIDWRKSDDVLMAEFKRLLAGKRGKQAPRQQESDFKPETWQRRLGLLKTEQKRGNEKALSREAQEAGRIVIEAVKSSRGYPGFGPRKRRRYTSRRQYFGFLDSGRYSQQRCCVLNPDDRTHNHR